MGETLARPTNKCSHSLYTSIYLPRASTKRTKGELAEERATRSCVGWQSGKRLSKMFSEHNIYGLPIVARFLIGKIR